MSLLVKAKRDGREHRPRHAANRQAGATSASRRYRLAPARRVDVAPPGRELCIVVLSRPRRRRSERQDVERELGKRDSVFDDVRACARLPAPDGGNVRVTGADRCRDRRCTRARRQARCRARCIEPASMKRSRARQGREHALRLRHPAADRARGASAGRRGAHAARALVELSAAQARHRRAAGRELARGNLLPPAESRRRASRSSASTPTTARSTSRSRSRTTTS